MKNWFKQHGVAATAGLFIIVAIFTVGWLNYRLGEYRIANENLAAANVEAMEDLKAARKEVKLSAQRAEELLKEVKELRTQSGDDAQFYRGVFSSCVNMIVRMKLKMSQVQVITYCRSLVEVAKKYDAPRMTFPGYDVPLEKAAPVKPKAPSLNEPA